MDYTKTLIDLSKQDEDVVKQFSALHPDLDLFVKERKDELKSLSTEQIIRYIVLCYDKESPVVDAYKKRWAVKKRESAIGAGLRLNTNGKFSKEVDDLIFCHDEVIDRVILRYLYLLHDRLWQTYTIYNEMYLHQSAEILLYNYQQPGHAKAAKENLDTLGKDIEELEFKIFSGEETKKLKDMLYEESANILNELRPEKIAVRLEQKQPAVDYNPYGEYVANKMRFLGDE